MRRDLICIAASCIALAACGGHQAIQSPVLPRTATPSVVQTGKVPVNWTQFNWGDAATTPNQCNSVVTGSDKNVWYTDYNSHSLIKITMTGATKIFNLTTNGSTPFYPCGMVVGKDGKFYIGNASPGGFIGVATTTGAFTAKVLASGDEGYVGGLALGSDGNVWFSEIKHIGKITTGGAITEFPYQDGNTGNSFGDVAAGPDGDIWVTEDNAEVVDDVDPSTGTMTAYTLPNCGPEAVLPGPDGNLWIACGNSWIRMTPGGSFTQFVVPFNMGSNEPAGFAVGVDGQPWFAIAGMRVIGEFNTSSNSITLYVPPSTFGNISGIGAGPDGNMWAIDSNKMTDVYIISPLGVSPASILTGFHAGNTQNITITQKGTAAWTVTSSSPGVATVTATANPAVWAVKAIGLGSTNVTVSDGKGNTFVVKVKVT